ncbi:MAG: glycoside hydrolase family 43 protein [Lachnospiraceae bacterium]|nr:glycoside hydrolase family 43 protein [Lachnospiraceae bacterium]
MTNNICNNPILPGFYPDPSLCRVGDDYYLVNSTFDYFPGVPIFHSKDLVNWKQIGNILDREEQIPLGNDNFVGAGIYAPTLRYHDGVFYMITTNIGSSNGNFIVTATDPAGPWSDPICLGSEGIDPSLFFDEDGKCYYHGTKGRREGTRFFGDNEIYVQELDLETMTLVGESWPIWYGALRGVEWAEGPHIFKHDGWYYLMISEAGTGHMHAVTIARSKSLHEPFEGYNGNPILTHRHLGVNYPIVNVGHPDIVETQNGEWWMVLLASRPYGGYYRNLGRETFLVKFEWENGWPLINPGKGLVEDTFPRPNLPEYKVEEKPAKDDFDYTSLPYNYMYVRNPKQANYSLTDKPGYLRLTPSTVKISDKIGSPSAICTRQLHMSYSFETTLEITPTANDAAGLVLLQGNYNNYQFCVTSDNNETKVKVLVCDGKEETSIDRILAEETLEYDNTKPLRITLRAVQKGQTADFSYSYDGSTYTEVLKGADTTILCTDKAGGFVGTCLGIYAQSISDSDNKVYFDSITYEGIE